MSLFNQFATSRKAEIEGVDVTFGGQNADGTIPSFRISRMSKSNKRYQKMLEQETKPHIHAIRNDNLAPEIDDAITLKIFTTTILLGWKHVIVPEVFTAEEHSVVYDNGDLPSVPYTPENAVRLFDKLPELYSTLRENAQKMSLFREHEIEADSKN